MADEFDQDPWNERLDYRDKHYPSAVARVRPMLTPRLHCEPDDDNSNTIVHNQSESAVDRFNRELRKGHGDR